MKKLLIGLLFGLMSVYSQAQQRPSANMDGSRLLEFLHNAKTNQSSSLHSSPAQLQSSLENILPASTFDKKWQVLIFLNTGNLEKWGAVDDTREELVKQFKAHHVEKAILFYSRQDGSSFLNIFQAKPQIKEKGYNPSDEPKYSYKQVDVSKLSAQEVLNRLMKQLQASPRLQTAILFKAHGSGHHMKIAMKTTDNKPYITIFHLVNALKANHLKVDLLDLSSCYMATMANIHHLLTGSDVKYLITSSNFSASDNTKTREIDGERIGFSTGPLALIKNLGQSPKEAALQTALAKYYPGKKVVHNVMVVDGDIYRQQVAPMLENWLPLATQGGRFNLPTSTFAKGLPGFAMLHLLRDISKATNAAPAVKSASQRLATALAKPILSYHCYNSYSQKEYSNITQVPYGDPCIAGFSIDNAAIDELKTHQVASKVSVEELNRWNDFLNRLERENYSSPVDNSLLQTALTQPNIERSASFYAL